LFTKKEIALIQKLNTPAKVQDFLNSLRFNFEPNSASLKSPIYTMRANNAHCMEGALLGAYMLSRHGFKPYLMLLKAHKSDFDHVIAPFKIGGYWGALSKTNHAVLRYREPIYKTLRELALSYFHEYFLNDGTKTLRSYSELLNLDTFQDDWATLDGDLWGIDEELDNIKHFETVPKSYIKKLRKADKVEIEAGKITEYEK
jgi:hypothetical protein